MERRQKGWTYAAISMVGIMVLVVGAWEYAGFGRAEREAQKTYDAIEATGTPLSEAGFVASFAVPADQNNAPQLGKALVSLERFQSKQREAATVQKYETIFKVGPTGLPFLPHADQLKMLAPYRPYLAAVRASSSRPYFVTRRDWSLPQNTIFPEYSALRLACKLNVAEAIYAAQERDRPTAFARLKEAFRFARFSGDEPTLISDLVQVAMIAITAQGVAQCIQVDPAGTAEYAACLDFKPRRPLGFYLRGEVYMFIGCLRNLTATELYKMMSSGYGDVMNMKLRNPRTEGVPPDRAVRAVTSYGLNQWLPVMRQFTLTGEVRDAKSFEKELVKMDKALEADDWSNRALALPWQLMTVALRQAIQAHNGAPVRLSLTRAFARVVQYYKANKAWPKSLAAVGVTDLDGNAPDPRPFGYRHSAKGMRVWSVGRDGKDNGGLTRSESYKIGKGSRDTDDAVVFYGLP